MLTSGRKKKRKKKRKEIVKKKKNTKQIDGFLQHVNLSNIILGLEVLRIAFIIHSYLHFVCLVWFGLVLWHINHYRLFNAKSIFVHINNSFSSNTV